MTSRQRRPVVASTSSVLDEIYSNGAPVEDTPPPPIQQPADTPPRRSGDVSHTRRTGGARASDTPAPAATEKGAGPAAATPAGKRTGTRTPAGKKRHSLYVDDDVAAELNAAADQISGQLGGMLPKHRVLAALIRAGINQAPTVAAQLRAELLDALQ